MEFNLYCPLIEHKISEVDYMENQSCAEGLLIPDSMPGGYRAKENWRDICLSCPHHESE